MPNQSAITTAERLVEEMFAHSDQRQNLESQVFSEVCRRLGVSKTRTTPLQPHSDRAGGTVQPANISGTGIATCPWSYGHTAWLSKSLASARPPTSCLGGIYGHRWTWFSGPRPSQGLLGERRWILPEVDRLPPSGP